MIKYATRLPPGKPVELLDNGMVRKTVRSYSVGWTSFMDALLKHMIRYPEPLVVPVYNYQLMGDTYMYDMMRCGILSSPERALVNSVGDLWDKHGTKACQHAGVDLRSELEKFPRLFEFLTSVTEGGRYFDLHSGNVMIDEDSNYCLVDLEGFIRTPLEQYANNWITRE